MVRKQRMDRAADPGAGRGRCACPVPLRDGRMNRRIVTMALGLVLSAAAGNGPKPRIECAEPVRRITPADVEAGEVRHTFRLRNTGNEALEIRRVETHCGCTDLNLSHRLVPPGAETQLSITLSLRGREGHVEKYLLVHSNDPQAPCFRLGFEGRVAPEADLLPMAALFGVIPEHGAVTQSVEVVFAPRATNRVQGADSDSPLFAATVEELEPGRRYRVHVFNAPEAGASASYLRARIRLRTERPTRMPLEIPVTAMAMDELLSGPDAIILVAGEPGPVTRYVAVRPGRVRAFRITGVDPPRAAIRTDVQRADHGYRIRLTGVPVDPALDGQALIIRTDAPGRPEIRIPFRFLREPSSSGL